MAPLGLQEEEILAYKVQRFPVLHDRRLKAIKNRNMVQNAKEKTAENWNFVENIFF